MGSNQLLSGSSLQKRDAVNIVKICTRQRTEARPGNKAKQTMVTNLLAVGRRVKVENGTEDSDFGGRMGVVAFDCFLRSPPQGKG